MRSQRLNLNWPVEQGEGRVIRAGGTARAKAWRCEIAGGVLGRDLPFQGNLGTFWWGPGLGLWGGGTWMGQSVIRVTSFNYVLWLQRQRDLGDETGGLYDSPGARCWV